MNEPNHICKFCGKSYYACNSCGQAYNFLPWRSVCCSFECYQKYLDLVLAARGEIEPVTVQTLEKEEEVNEEILGSDTRFSLLKLFKRK